jgi:YgiT-type zinc finger domain-containing protein
LSATTVRTTIWQGDRVAIVEDIPAHVCGACLEQFYDDAVSEALRRLAEEGFPAAKAEREITVPVFSLPRHLQSRPILPDDTYVD